MKILEAQSATLTNYEVYVHLIEQRARYEAAGKPGKHGKKRRGPGNLETVVKELLDYLRAPPSPLGDQPIPYNENTIKTLLVRLRPYQLTKAEILMIMNHRPTKVAALDTVVEELGSRIPDENDQYTMVSIIKEVLGSPDAAAQLQKMEEAAKGRREEVEEASREQMVVEEEGT